MVSNCEAILVKISKNQGFVEKFCPGSEKVRDTTKVASESTVNWCYKVLRYKVFSAIG